MDLEAVCDELYGLSPPEFTPARDAKAAEARKAGDRDLAAAIKQLKRPGQAAWLANVLARQRPHRVDELLLLGDRLRDAQRRLAGDEMKELARAGHAVVGDLVPEADRLAVAAGQRTSPGALRQLQETLDAALADPDAGQALRAGRLTVPLSYAGLGSLVDTEPEGHHVDENEARASEQARAARAESERRVAELTAELQSAHRRRDRIGEQMEELQRQLRQVQAQGSDVDRVIQKLEADISEATGEMESSAARVGGLPAQD